MRNKKTWGDSTHHNLSKHRSSELEVGAATPSVPQSDQSIESPISYLSIEKSRTWSDNQQINHMDSSNKDA